MIDRKIFAVAGRPVLQSLSPRLFRSAYPETDSAAYTRISASAPEEALRIGLELGLAGMNITAPLKEGVFGLLDVADETAAALGAVNTLVREGGTFRGYNTDPAGIVRALEGSGIDIRGERCCVLGAGGAGRAAVFALRSRGAEVVLCNRTARKALDAARKFGAVAEKWENRSSAIAGSEVLVSALPPDVSSVRPEWLRPGLVVLEAAYPAPPLTRAARDRGCRVIPGEEWLLGQAVPAFRNFTNSEPDKLGMERALKSGEKDLSRRPRNISLVGFMGSGKTSVGRLLAGRLGWDFHDSDEWIERRAGRSIPEIFRTEGEAYFRDLEAEALKELLAGRPGVVCACGGGSMQSGANRAAITGHSVVVWLHANLATCRSRVDASTRPLLNPGSMTEEAFGELFQTRISCYAEAADVVVGSETEADRTARVIYEEIHRVIAD
jgi:shikimate dehydrogenase